MTLSATDHGGDEATEYIRVLEDGDIAVVQVAPSYVDAECADQVERELTALVEKDGKKKIVLDLLHVSSLLSYSLGRFARFQKRVKRGGGSVVFCNLQGPVHDALSVTGLIDHLNVCDNVQEALNSFSAR